MSYYERTGALPAIKSWYYLETDKYGFQHLRYHSIPYPMKRQATYYPPRPGKQLIRASTLTQAQFNALMAKKRQQNQQRGFRKPFIHYGKFTQSHPGGEIKGIDITNATTPTLNSSVPWTLNTTGKLNCLNLITIGTSAWNRIGRKIAMKSFRLRGYLGATANAVAGPTVPVFHRFVLIYDKQSNGALPILGDVFLDQSSVTADASITLLTSGLNLNNRDRFEVLLDRQFMMSPSRTDTGVAGNTGITCTTDGQWEFDWFINLKNRETHYKSDGSPAVIGDVATGGLIFITFGNIAAGSEPYNLNASIRLRYSDL